MKLYTTTGDGGETSLFDGARVSKDDARVAAYGDIDELNAVLGWCRSAAATSPNDCRLARLQHEMFMIGAELATPAESQPAARVPTIQTADCERLEKWIDEAAAATEPLSNFILPGGSEPAARLHVARTCCRRAERSIVTLRRTTPVRDDLIVYLNRLSDLLFAWARQANHEAGQPDVVWVQDK